MKETAEKLPSIWTPAFVALIVVNLLTLISQFASLTVLPLYVRDLGAAPTIVGFIAGAYAISALVIRPFFAPAIDSFSKKKLLLIVNIVLAASYFSYTLASSVTALLIVRFINGIGIGCAAPLVMALAGDTLPPQRMSGGIGLFMMAAAGGQVIGPAFGIEASRAFGYPLTFVALGCFAVVSTILLVVFIREKPHPDVPPYQIRPDRIFAKQAVVPALTLFFIGLSISCTSSFMAIYGSLNGVDRISLFFVVYALVVLGTRAVFGRLADAHGTTPMFLIATALFALSYVVVSFATTLPVFLAAAVIAGCGFGSIAPLMHALTFKCVPPNRRGAGSTTNYTGIDAGMLVGPYVGGVVVERYLAGGVAEVTAYSHMWIVMLVPVALGVIVYLSQAKRLARYQMEASANNGQ